jgi:hypothetical protein
MTGQVLRRGEIQMLVIAYSTPMRLLRNLFPGP